MVLDRSLADEETLADRGVAFAAGSEPEDVELALAERRQPPTLELLARLLAKALGDRLREPGGEHRVALRHPADRLDDLGRGRVLEDVAVGPGAKRPADPLRVAETGEHEHPRRRGLRPQPLEDGDPALARKLDVEDHDRRLLRAHGGKHLVAALDLADDGEVLDRLEQPPQPLAEERMIVADEDSDRHDHEDRKGPRGESSRDGPRLVAA